MCKKCNDTGYIYFGSDTFTGTEKVKCNCKCCKNKNTKEENKDAISRCNNYKRNGKK